MALILRSCMRPSLGLTRFNNVVLQSASWHLPMCTSLCHRVTGVVMGCALYGIGVGLAVGPYDFSTYVDIVKNWNIPQPIMFLVKTLMAFPLCYHYVNGMRHLSWDAGVKNMFLLSTQYKTGTLIISGAIVAAMLLASLSYVM